MIKVSSPEIQEFERDHLEKLRALAPECMVLLKKSGDFPLDAPCKIALYGSGARETIKGGTGSGDVNVRHYVTVEEGLENVGFTVTTKAWMDGYKAAKDAQIKGFYEGIAAEAKAQGKSVFLVGLGRTPPEPHYDLPIDGEGEACVYVLARNSGEGADRPGSEGDLLLSEVEVRDILLCAERYEKFMLALNVGGPVDLSPVLDKARNVLLLSQLGSVTGDAFADVLLGKAYPSGKLTTTWGELTLAYADGGSEVIATDKTFDAATGPVVRTDLQAGEIYDARMKPDGWRPAAVCAEHTEGRLIESQSVPVREKERFTGKPMRDSAGNLIIDFGQNIAGYVGSTPQAHENSGHGEEAK